MYLIQHPGVGAQAALRKLVMLGLRYVVCIVVAFFVLIPIVTVVIGGFKTSGELANTPFSLPTVWHWETYATILLQSAFWSAIENSTMVTLATVGLLLLIACPAAFVLARISFRGREMIFNIILFGLLFPVSMATLPL